MAEQEQPELKENQSMTEKVKEKVKEKTEQVVAKIDEKVSKQMDDFMEQMKLLDSAMKEAGYQLSDISLIIRVIPAISCTVENIDDDKYWQDASIDEDQLNKTGKAIVVCLKKADKVKKLFKGKTIKLNALHFECTISPSLTFSFKPRSNVDVQIGDDQEYE